MYYLGHVEQGFVGCCGRMGNRSIGRDTVKWKLNMHDRSRKRCKRKEDGQGTAEKAEQSRAAVEASTT